MEQFDKGDRNGSVETEIQMDERENYKMNRKPLNAAQLLIVPSGEEKEAHPPGHVVLDRKGHSSFFPTK